MSEIKLKSLREVLLEMPMKIPGDAPFETLDYTSKSINGIKDDFDFIINYDKVEVYAHKRLNWIIAGKPFYDEKMKEERFGIIGEVSFSNKSFLSTLNKILKKRPVISIDTVHVREAERRTGLASFLYKVLLSKFNVMSDKVQYEKASAMWKKFATETDNTIYLYDSKEDKIISKMTTKTPDSHIWSNDASKMKIQMIMIEN